MRFSHLFAILLLTAVVLNVNAVGPEDEEQERQKKDKHNEKVRLWRQRNPEKALVQSREAVARWKARNEDLLKARSSDETAQARTNEYYRNRYANMKTEDRQQIIAKASARYEKKKKGILTSLKINRLNRTPSEVEAESMARKAKSIAMTDEELAMARYEKNLKSLKRRRGGPGKDQEKYAVQHKSVLMKALQNPHIKDSDAIKMAQHVYNDWTPSRAWAAQNVGSSSQGQSSSLQPSQTPTKMASSD